MVLSQYGATAKAANSKQLAVRVTCQAETSAEKASSIIAALPIVESDRFTPRGRGRLCGRPAFLLRAACLFLTIENSSSSDGKADATLEWRPKEGPAG